MYGVNPGVHMLMYGVNPGVHMLMYGVNPGVHMLIFMFCGLLFDVLSLFRFAISIVCPSIYRFLLAL
jgi:hypothetical protein